MPQSHHKQKTKHHQKNQTPVEKKRRMSAGTFMAVMGAIFGLSFGWFTSDQNLSWTIAGTIAGTALGYLFGRAIDRSVSGK